MAAPCTWRPRAPLCDQVQDQDALQQALEQKLSKDQMNALLQCRQLLRDSAQQQLHPEKVLAPVSSMVFALPAGQSQLAVALPHRPLEEQWGDYSARIFCRAEAEGLHRATENGMWFCPHCDREISEGFLESHMDSSKHQRYKAWGDHKLQLEERHARGELPDWMDIRDGAEFCKLCDTAATEAHLYSARHKKALAWHEEGGASTEYTVASQSSTCCILSVPTPQFPVPADWGDPNHFEWKAEDGRYWCRLCWKYADEAHVYSEKHALRETQAERYLETDFGSVSAFPDIPPPPPPRSTFPGVAPQQPISYLPDVAPPPPSGIPPPSRSGALAKQPAEKQLPSQPLSSPVLHWERYAVDEEQTAFWWWCEANGDSFLERSPGEWCKYADPTSGKPYWWLSDEHWFWEHSGSHLI